MAMRMSYTLVKVIGEGLVGLDHPEYGRQIWSRCKVRKIWDCKASEKRIRPGEGAWRPVTNGQNRMHRISNFGMNYLLDINEPA